MVTGIVVRYRVREKESGYWVVTQGNKYFPGTMTNCRKSAQIAAIEMSKEWYEGQIELHIDKLREMRDG